MEHKIIADSCCDMTPQLRERLGVVSVPLFIRLGEKEFIDDSTLDLDGFIDEMKYCTEKVPRKFLTLSIILTFLKQFSNISQTSVS